MIISFGKIRKIQNLKKIVEKKSNIYYNTIKITIIYKKFTIMQIY